MNRKTLLGFALGPLGGAVAGVITVPVVAWLFTAEDVGRLNIMQVVTSFVVLGASLGLDQAYVREFHEAEDRGRLLRATFLPGLVVLAVCAAVALALHDVTASVLFDIADPRATWLAVGVVAVAFIARFASLVLRMQERALAFSVSQLTPKVGLVLGVGVIGLAGLSADFLALQIVLLAAGLLSLVPFILMTRRDWHAAGRARLRRSELRAYARFGLPLVVSGLAYWGLTATSSFTLRAAGDLDELGVYSVAVSLAGVAGVVQSFFSIIWAPIVYRWVATGVDPARVDKVVRQLLAVVWAVFVAVGLFSWVADYVLPAHYAQVKYLVVGTIVPPLLYVLSEASAAGIGISRRSILSVWASVVALAVSIGLNVWLVPTLGARGSVAANAIAYLVFFTLRTEFAASAWRQFPRQRTYLVVLVLVALSATTAVFGEALGPRTALLWCVAGLGGLIVHASDVRRLIRARGAKNS